MCDHMSHQLQQSVVLLTSSMTTYMFSLLPVGVDAQVEQGCFHPCTALENVATESVCLLNLQ